MSKLYNSFTEKIARSIHKGDNLVKSIGSLSDVGPSQNLTESILNEERYLEPKTELHTLASLLGITDVKKPFKGDHPDFAHLRNAPGTRDYHYIVSVFIDVKGSTKFHTKYSLDQIAVIIQTIVAAATHTISLFGGHIQRLQYDGVFCYFGGKGITKDDAVKNAMLATSFFSYFIRYELREVFADEGFDNIYTRIGIDFGDDQDVQWIVFGTENCDELTTNSLHTSLAPKMQANAPSNGIMIGQYVYDRLGAAQMFADFLRDDKGNVDETTRYIYRDTGNNFSYSQRRFAWDAYLKNTFWFVKQNPDGSLYIDYTASRTTQQQEQQRLNSLHAKSAALAAGTASIDTTGHIQPHSEGTPIPSNRFYYDNRRK